MIAIHDVEIGSRVHYQPSHYGDRYENGLVKEIRAGVTDAIWVVYNCAGEWDRYQEYTSAKTNVGDLYLGWRYDAIWKQEG